MTRWEPGTAARLYRTALELFAKQGVAGTTVDEIAGLAGVTPRTFHRLFRDKEEVLFFRDAEMELLLVEAIDRLATPGTEPAGAALGALLELFDVLEQERPELVLRQQVLGTDLRLLGRQLVKQAGWQRAMTERLVEVGHPRVAAALGCARAAAIANVAFDEWLRHPGGSLRAMVLEVAALEHAT